MITIARAQSKLTAQGAGRNALSDCITALQASNFLPPHTDIPLSTRELTALLIGSTSPDPAKAAEHVIQYAALTGELGTLGDALRNALSNEAAGICITAVRVCQSFPMARIEFSDGDLWEFSAEPFTGCGVRREVVLSGGLICDFAYGLRNDTASGWKEKIDGHEG